MAEASTHQGRPWREAGRLEDVLADVLAGGMISPRPRVEHLPDPLLVVQVRAFPNLLLYLPLEAPHLGRQSVEAV